jgi:hypothetical protein
MAEGTAPPQNIRMLNTLEESRQVQRSLTEKILDKAASDLRWKERLLDDPEVALQEADFPESQWLVQLRQQMRPQEGVTVSASEAEVLGQGGSIKPRQCYTPVAYFCEWFSLHWTKRYGEEQCWVSTP